MHQHRTNCQNVKILKDHKDCNRSRDGKTIGKAKNNRKQRRIHFQRIALLIGKF